MIVCPLLFLAQPWSTPDLRKEYIDFLQCQPYRNETCRGEADRITSFDRLCSMSVNFCVEGGICEDDTYANITDVIYRTKYNSQNYSNN